MRTVALLALLTLSAALHAAAGAPPQDPSQSSAGATDVTDTRICLNMIVKNEADTLPQLFESMVEHIFGGVICDTGSTDGTVQYIHAYFAEHGLQGEVVHHNWTDNFGHNRNLCLSEVMRWSKENAPPGHDNLCDYFMFLDADQVLQKEPGEENSNLNLKRMGLDQDAYLMSEREAVAGMMYSNIRLASTRKVWEWEGAVHEVVHMTDGSAHVENTKTIAGMYFTHDADGGPNGKRYERDATILEHTIEEEPENTRAHFYLAQTYNSLQRWGDALRMYMKRVGMSHGWIEENYVAAYEIAELSRWDMEVNNSVDDVLNDYLTSWTSRLSMDPEYSVIRAYLAAHEILPYRQEPLHRLAYVYRTRFHNFHNCFAYAAMAHALGPPKSSSLFVDGLAYKFGVLDEMCVCGFYAERYEEGLAACRKLESALLVAEARGEPHPYHESMVKRTRAAMPFFEEQLNLEKEEAACSGALDTCVNPS